MFGNDSDSDDDSSILKIIASLKLDHKNVYDVTYFIVFYVIWKMYDLYSDINFNLQIFFRKSYTINSNSLIVYINSSIVVNFCKVYIH